MKARIPPKHRLTKEILDVAIREAKRQADEQIDDVCKRCTNEFYVAMHQAGLSPKTIKKVSTILKEVVIPHCVNRALKTVQNFMLAIFMTVMIFLKCTVPSMACRMSRQKGRFEWML